MADAVSDFREEAVLGKAYDWRLMKRFLRYLKPYKGRVALAILILLGITGSTLLSPYIVKVALDGPITKGLKAADKTPFLNELLILVGLYFFLLLVRFVLGYARVYIVRSIGQSAIHDMRCELFSHLQRLDLAFYNKNPVGRLVTRVTNDIEALSELFSQGVVALINDVFMLFGIILVMALVSWRMTLLAMAVVPPLVLLAYFFRKKARHSFGEIRRRLAKINSFINETILGIRVIHMFEQQEERDRRHRALDDDLLKEYKAVNLYMAFFYPSVEMMAALGTALIIYYAAHSVLAGVITVGVFFLFWNLFRRFFQPIMDLADKYNMLQSAMASAERVFKILDTEPAIEQKTDGYVPKKVKGEVELSDIEFSYDDEEKVLKGISLKVGAGERVALVGPTGAGKTSIINLIARLWEPQRGSVKIDGVDVREWRTDALRSALAIVPQDVFIFYGTVSENISLWDRNITKERIEEAAKASCAHDFITRLEEGYETVMAERGATLSVGQRQLLSFARALARTPPIIVLDEATSSIDSETEQTIQKAMENILEGRTALIIAHRLSTIEKCDRIVVVDDGRIVEEGTHKELLSKRGLYWCLYTMQEGRI